MKTASKNTTIVLIQDRSDLEHYKKFSDLIRNDNVQLIALTPVADYLLERAGLPYRTIEEFYDDASIAKQAVESNLPQLEDTCHKIDAHLQNHLKALDGHDGFSIFYSFFGFKILHDNVFLKVSQLSGLFDTLRPRRVICATCEMPAWYEGKSFEALLRSNQLYSIITPWVAKHRNIEVISLSQQRRMSLSDVKTSVKYVLSRSLPTVISLGVQLRHMISGRASTARKVDSNAPGHSASRSVFAFSELTQHFEVEVIRELIRRAHHIFPLENSATILNSYTQHSIVRNWKKSIPLLKQSIDEIKRDPKIRRFFVIGEIDFANLFIPALERVLSVDLPASYRTMSVIRDVLLQTDKPIVLTASGGSIEGRAAISVKVPALIFQHGGGWGYLDVMPIGEYRELFAGTHYLCSGSKTGEVLSRTYPHLPERGLSQRPKVVPIGMARLDMLREHPRVNVDFSRGVTDKKLRVLVLISNLYGDSRYFTNTLYPDILLWRAQKETLQTCRRYDINLTVKLYPKSAVRNVLYPNPLQDWIEESKFPARIEHNAKYTDLLAETDLVIMDSCQTTFLEALAANKAVITLADKRWMHFYQDAKTILPKNAFVAESFDEFFALIGNCLANPLLCRGDSEDNRFLKAYGNHLDDGKSAERAVDFIESL